MLSTANCWVFPDTRLHVDQLGGRLQGEKYSDCQVNIVAPNIVDCNDVLDNQSTSLSELQDWPQEQ